MAMLREPRKGSRNRPASVRSSGGAGDRAFANSGKNAFDNLTSYRGIFQEGQKRVAAAAGVPLDRPTYVTGEQLGRAKAEVAKVKQELKNSQEFDKAIISAATYDRDRMKSWCNRQEHRSKMFVDQFEAKHELAQANMVNRAGVEMMDIGTNDTAKQVEASRQQILAGSRLLQYA